MICGGEGTYLGIEWVFQASALQIEEVASSRLRSNFLLERHRINNTGVIPVSCERSGVVQGYSSRSMSDRIQCNSL